MDYCENCGHVQADSVGSLQLEELEGMLDGGENHLLPAPNISYSLTGPIDSVHVEVADDGLYVNIGDHGIGLAEHIWFVSREEILEFWGGADTSN